MAEIDVYDFDYLAGQAQAAQAVAADVTAQASAIVATGTTAQVIGFNASGQPEAKSVGGNGNGVTLAFSGNTLQVNADQDLKTSGKPTFAGIKIDSTGTIIEAVLYGSVTLDFPSTAAQQSSDLTVTVTGAADGDPVFLGVPNAAVNANSCYTAWVSAANTVSVRFSNYSAGAIDPASATFKVAVFKF